MKKLGYAVKSISPYFYSRSYTCVRNALNLEYIKGSISSLNTILAMMKPTHLWSKKSITILQNPFLRDNSQDIQVLNLNLGLYHTSCRKQSSFGACEYHHQVPYYLDYCQKSLQRFPVSPPSNHS